MRIYIPPEAGLGAPEISALRRLSRPALSIIADELTEPGSHEAVRWILKQKDPERALAETISENVQYATDYLVQNPGSGMGDLLGKSFFKKLHKVFKKVLVSIPKKVLGKIGKIDPIAKALKPTLKKVANVVRKNLPIIITVAGGVLAPFTGGASLAAAAVLVTARQLYAAKVDAHKALVAGKAEAGAMQAQVDQQTAQVMQQADQVYTDNQSIFLAAGYDQATWNALTLDQKIDLITQASNGTLKPTAAAIAAQQAAEAQINQSAAQTATSTAAAQMQNQGPTTGGSSQPYTGSSASPSYPSQGDSSSPPPPPESAPEPEAPQVPEEKAPAASASSGGGGTALAVLAAATLAIISSGSGKRR